MTAGGALRGHTVGELQLLVRRERAQLQQEQVGRYPVVRQLRGANPPLEVLRVEVPSTRVGVHQSPDDRQRCVRVRPVDSNPPAPTRCGGVVVCAPLCRPLRDDRERVEPFYTLGLPAPGDRRVDRRGGEVLVA